MGFRNPFRIQVDSKGIAYITDYSPDSQIPQTHRGPQGTGRVEIVRAPANYGWPVCMTPNVPYYEWDFNLSTPLDPANPQPFECNNPAKGPDNESRWNTGADDRPGECAGPRPDPAVDPAGHLVLVPRQQPGVLPGHAVPRGVRRGPAEPPRRRWRGSGHLPAALPRAVHGRRRAARGDDVRVRPEQPERDQVPAVLRRGHAPRRVHAGHDARDPVRREQPGPRDQPVPQLRSGLLDDLPVRVRQPDGPAVRGRRELLPAHLRRRLLRSQRRRRHVPVGVHEGPAASARPGQRHAAERPGPADRPVQQRGLARRGSWRLDPVRVGLQQRRHGRLDGPEPAVHVHGQRGLHGPADGDGLDRAVGLRQHGDHGGQHRADADDQHAAGR